MGRVRGWSVLVRWGKPTCTCIMLFHLVHTMKGLVYVHGLPMYVYYAFPFRVRYGGSPCIWPISVVHSICWVICCSHIFICVRVIYKTFSFCCFFCVL